MGRGVNMELLEPAKASQLCMQAAESQADHVIFSNVALWPIEQDLLVATDFAETQYSEQGDFEPVMYVASDTHGLIGGAPRFPLAAKGLDICCGNGVQGLVALRHYAE